MGSSCSKLEDSSSPPRLVSVADPKLSAQSNTAPSVVITAASENNTPISTPGNNGAPKLDEPQLKNSGVETGIQKDSVLSGTTDHKSEQNNGTVVDKSNIDSLESGSIKEIEIDNDRPLESTKVSENDMVHSSEVASPLNQETGEASGFKKQEETDPELDKFAVETNGRSARDLNKKADNDWNDSGVDDYDEDLVDGDTDRGGRSDDCPDILSITDVSQWESKGGVTLIRVGNKNTKTNKIVVETQGEVDITAVASEDLPVQTEVLNQSVQGDELKEVIQKMAGIGELCITKPAPLFESNSVVDGDFQTVKLSDYRGKYVVLFFYPLDFTFVCPTEIIAFSDRAEEFKAIGCEVMACSTDSVYSHLAWVNTPRKQGGLGPMKIPLIADKTLEISKKYGCLKEDEGVAFRGLFIIDDKGNLRQITINDLPVGRSVDETLRLVQAFQFTDKHGEVCPAGWKPGKETMKPEPKASKEYFNKSN